MFLAEGLPQYLERVNALQGKIAEEWPTPKVVDLLEPLRLQKVVCKSIFWVFFGKWITDEEALILTGWRTNALYFILPRMVHRFIFNLGIRKVKALRRDTVAIVEKYELQPTFRLMNQKLGKHHRKTVVELCDEIMFAVGF